MPNTIRELLNAGADDATALSSPGGKPLSYKSLRALVADIGKALATQGIGAEDATAVSPPGGRPLPAKSLGALVADIGKTLATQGIGAIDRVGIVLDNGPEMAASFLCLASCATAAPLNPGYRADEFEFYLT